MDRTSEEQDKDPSYLVYEFERRAYPLSDVTFTIGRDAASDIVVREPAVSRSHAEVRPEAGEFMLHTTGATGTMLNGEPLVSPAKLDDGDRISIGSLEFTFRRGRLPLGVAVVDTVSAGGHDADAMTRRTTITNPILGAAATAPPRAKSPTPAILLLGLLIAAAAWYFLV
jgi:pSer/pThr/pTyr-binding forkhead associated (FHA) protein